MQKIKDFCKRHRLLWLTLLVALAAAAVAAWAGFDLGQRVDNQPVYEIVNDDYTRTVVIPATADAATQDDGTTGLYLPVPLKSGQRIYGVRLDLTPIIGRSGMAPCTLHCWMPMAMPWRTVSWTALPLKMTPLRPSRLMRPIPPPAQPMPKRTMTWQTPT